MDKLLQSPRGAERDREEAPPGKFKVLLIAEACSPAMTSIPLEGYNLASALARHPRLEVTLVTQVRNRDPLRDDPLSRLADVHFIDTEYITIPLMNLCGRFRKSGVSWTVVSLFYYPTYIAFENLTYELFKRRLREGEFDLIHRITPLSPVSAGPLAYRTDVPMIVGPLNGGLPWPKEYPDLVKKEGEYLKKVRFLYKYLPHNFRMYRRLKGVIAGSQHTATEIPRGYRGGRYFLEENGIDPDRFPLAERWPEPGPDGAFRFVTVGRLVPYKGMDLILEAMHGSTALGSSRLTIIGDGPIRGELEAQAARLGLGDRVEFTGHLDQDRLSAVLRASQAFVFPSLREFGGAVVIEAMACGLPPIVVDYGGPGEHVTPECGIALPMQPRDRMVPQLRAAMESLATDHDFCRRLSAAGIRRIREKYTWDFKAGKIVEFYQDMLAR